MRNLLLYLLALCMLSYTSAASRCIFNCKLCINRINIIGSNSLANIKGNTYTCTHHTLTHAMNGKLKCEHKFRRGDREVTKGFTSESEFYLT